MTTNMPYNNYYQALTVLDGIEAIDFFLAAKLLETSTVNLDDNPQQITLLFHLFIALSESQRNGHSCLDLSLIANQQLWCTDTVNVNDSQAFYPEESTPGFTFPALNDLQACLASFLQDDSVLNELGTSTNEHLNSLIVFDCGYLYLRRYWQFECQLASFIETKVSTPVDSNNISTHSDVDQSQNIIDALFGPVEPHADIDWQRVSVANALNKSFSIIAGGPGTGKTYTVTKLLAGLLMQNPDVQIKMVAPTGKAAQRLSESINQAVANFVTLGNIDTSVLELIPTTASTIHRLLGVIKNSPNFRHDQHNPLTLDVLLIDEVSMVDLPMMTRIFRALPNQCKVILLGDAEQLPSVATGSVLADLAPFGVTQYSPENKDYIGSVSMQTLNSDDTKVSIDYLTYLTFSRRFSGDGGIGKLAKLVIAGEADKSWQLLTNNNDSELDYIDNKSLPDHIKHLTKQYYAPLFHLNNIEQAFSQFNKFRILAPTRSGDSGLENLNKLVEEQLIKLDCILPNNALYHGRPIMISQNHYGVNLFNGDIGILFKATTGEHAHRLMAYFIDGEAIRAVSISRLPAFETVYAMTIHKTQGSEFDHVAIVLPEQASNRLLSRELIYTGITRAKKHLQIFSNKAVWSAGVKQKVSRASGLTKRLMSFLT
ncbi:exodeoxyribonuclease V subunit alpha [Colwelliaceae bacterium BS250]